MLNVMDKKGILKFVVYPNYTMFSTFFLLWFLLHVKGNFLCFQLFVIDNLIKFLLYIFFYSLYLYLNKTEHRKRERIYYPLESCTKLHQQFLLNCKLSWKVFILFLFLYVFLVCLFVRECVLLVQKNVFVCVNIEKGIMWCIYPIGYSKQSSKAKLGITLMFMELLNQ